MDERTTGAFEVAVSDTKTSMADEWVRTYYWKFEQLLDRIEFSSNHYQLLSISRSATKEQVRQAYKQTQALLNPFYLPIDFHLPDEIQVRIKQAIEQGSLAGSILLNFGKL